VEIFRELAVSGGAWGTGSGYCESILAQVYWLCSYGLGGRAKGRCRIYLC
jgi:hypothetical protein